MKKVESGNSINPIRESCDCVCGESKTLSSRLIARDEISGEIFAYETCWHCGTQRLRLRPAPDQIGAYYPDTYYAYAAPTTEKPPPAARLKWLIYRIFYESRPSAHISRKLLNLILYLPLFPLRRRSNLAFRPPSLRHVFEFGAATGRDLLEFRDAGWHVSGCEPSSKACAVAAQRHISLQNCSAEDAKLHPQSIGCAFINNVFEHLHEPDSILRKVRQALVPDGVVIVIVPNHASLGATLFGAAWPGYDPPRHLWGFTLDSICQLIKAHGFEIEYVDHKAPQRWSWHACIEGARRPCGASPASARWAQWVAPLLVPLGVLAALARRGDFIKVVARKPSRIA